MPLLPKSQLLALVSAFVALPCCARVAPLPPSGVFVYSNACVSEGGDFSGFRVTLRRTAKGVTGRIGFNDDGPDGDDVLRQLRFDPKSGALRFGFRGGEGGNHTFAGTISRERLAGRFDTAAFTLPLLRRIPRRLPDC